MTTTWQTAMDAAEDNGRRMALAQRRLGMTRDDSCATEAGLNDADRLWYAAVMACGSGEWQPLDVPETVAYEMADWTLYGYTAEWEAAY